MPTLRPSSPGEKIARQNQARRLRLINGAHVVIYSKDPEADRAFFRDVLRFPCVDAGHG